MANKRKRESEERREENVDDALEEISADAVHSVMLSERRATYDPVSSINEVTSALLNELGLHHLFTHQAHTRSLFHAGAHVSLCTGTASGKSLAFALPLLELLGQKGQSRKKALLLTPQKALARDQGKQLRQVVAAAQRASERKQKFAAGNRNVLKRIGAIGIAHLDGDVPGRQQRKQIVSNNRVLISNPDFVHSYLLPRHKDLPALFNNLCTLVVDEAHSYLGVFGSHVALVLRRLIRLVEASSGITPQVVTASATIGNPKEHAEDLTGLPFKQVDTDGAPRGKRGFVLLQPAQLQNPSGETTKRSANSEAVERLKALVKREIRTLCFVSSRKQAEEVARLLHLHLAKEGSMNFANLQDRVDSYRGGYSAEVRADIEGRLKRGELLCVVTTSALELGIDIGSLDACVQIGCPRTAATQHQQLGRAGRRNTASIGVIIAAESPLDQYFLSKPTELFDRSVENAVINPCNRHMLAMHLPHAANEARLLADNDAERFGGSACFKNATDALVSSNKLFADSGSTLSAPPLTTLPIFGLRSMRSDKGGDFVQLLDVGKNASEPYEQCNTSAITEARVELERAYHDLHHGAVYLHRNTAWNVLRLDVHNRVAYVQAHDDRTTTQPLETRQVYADPQALPSARRWRVKMVQAWVGQVIVEASITGFEVLKKSEGSRERREFNENQKITLPRLTTDALWIEVPEEAMQKLGPENAASGASALAMLLGDLASTEALCSESDVAATTSQASSTGESPLGIWLYDVHGGVGLCDELSNHVNSLLKRAHGAIENCICENGCPKCILRGRGCVPNTSAQRAKDFALTLSSGMLGTWLQSCQE